MERVDGYMKRAEDLKNVLEGLNSQAKGGKLNVYSVETLKRRKYFILNVYRNQETDVMQLTKNFLYLLK